MLKSMTGYGRAKELLGGREITAEIRSVNHRYLDITIKTPRVYGFLEEPIKLAVQKSAYRGKIEVYISVGASQDGDIRISLNRPVLSEYLNAFCEIKNTFPSLTDDLTVASIARFPDVLTTQREETDDEAIKNAVMPVLEEALSGFSAMRQREGERLCRDMGERAESILQMVEQVEKRSPETVTEYREKITSRMQEIMADSGADPQRILAEAALFADKVSVTEEIVRLRSHLSQFMKMIRETAPIGRKLDFLVQELNREANTIGSKANDYDIVQTVIEMKAEIEKIREQIQNIE